MNVKISLWSCVGMFVIGWLVTRGLDMLMFTVFTVLAYNAGGPF